MPGCYFPSKDGTQCGKRVKAKKLCGAHYQAIHIRKIPIEKLLEDEDDRIENAVDVHVRISGDESEKLNKAIKDGRAKGPRYSFFQRTVRGAIKAL
jgi:hypothetical protein